MTAWRCSQQGDEPLFGADVAVDEFVGVVKVADDGGLFFNGWKGTPMYVLDLRLNAYGRDWPWLRNLTKVYAFKRVMYLTNSAVSEVDACIPSCLSTVYEWLLAACWSCSTHFREDYPVLGGNMVANSCARAWETELLCLAMTVHVAASFISDTLKGDRLWSPW